MRLEKYKWNKKFRLLGAKQCQRCYNWVRNYLNGEFTNVIFSHTRKELVWTFMLDLNDKN